MLRHHLSLTLRRIRRQPTYSSINVLGLVLGLACAFITTVYVSSEFTFDQMHAEADRIYRVETIHPQNGNPERWASTPTFVADEFHRLAAIEDFVRLQRGGNPLVTRPGTKTRFYEDAIIGAEASFFSVFDYSLQRGVEADLDRPFTAVLSATAAEKYFGDEDPMGQTIALYSEWSAGSTDYEVVGLMDDMPKNVHVRADILLSIRAVLDEPRQERSWSSGYTYVRLSEGTSQSQFEAQLRDAVLPVVAGGEDGPKFDLATIPLTRIHLHSEALHDIVPQGSIRYIYLFVVIAVLVLLIACINYVNLATALASQRAREVGVRKTVGARQQQLVKQFVGEAVLLTAIAAALAVLLTYSVLPVFNAFTGRSLTLDANSPILWFGVLTAVGLVGPAAGLYPAYVLSRFRPALVLKGQTRGSAMPALLKVLTVAQFAISIGLILSTLVIERQMAYVQDTRLGFDQEQLLVVRTRSALPESQAETFAASLASLPGVVGVARADGIPGELTGITVYRGAEVEDFDGEWAQFDIFQVDEHYADVLDIELAAGRLLDAGRGTDEASAVLVNESAVASLGWGDAANAIGKRLGEGEDVQTVVGVIRDFHYQDMRTEIGSALLSLSGSARRYYPVRFTTADVPALLTGLERVWDEFIPEQPFDYSFMSDDFAAMYREEQRLGSLFAVFAGLAICIACLGLFGLTAFSVQRRTKEIGIRKVLGASANSLMLLLSRDLVRMLVIALLVGGPPAYIAMRRWLSQYVYHTELGWDVFALAGCAALLVAVVAMSYHVLRATRANPVKSLRYE